MGNKLRCETPVPKFANHRVQKKRHIVVDDIDNEEAGAFDGAVAKNDLRLMALPGPETFKRAGGKGGQVAGLIILQLPNVRFTEKLFGEAPGKPACDVALQALHNGL